MATENDISLQRMRDAAESITPEVKRRAFGVAVVYSKDGKILRESSDGSIEVIRSSKAREILVRNKISKIG